MAADQLVVWAGLGLLNLTFAALVLSVRPRGAAHWLVGLWFIANGIGVPMSYAAWHLGLLEPPGVWGSIGNAFEFLTVIPLVVLPLVFPRRILSKRILASIVGVLGLLILASWFVSGLTSIVGHSAPTGIPTTVVKVGTSVVAYVGLAVGAILLASTYVGASSRIQQDQARYFLTAYVLTAATFATMGPHPSDLLAPLLAGTFPQPTWNLGNRLVEPAARMLAGAFATAAVLVALGSAHVRAWRHGGSRPWQDDAFIAAFALGGLLHPFVGLDGMLVWMFARPVLLTYGVLRYRLLDVDLRRRAPLVGAAVVLGIAVVFTHVSSTLDAAGLPASASGGIAVALAFAGAGALAWPVVERVVAAGNAGRDSRGREVYRAALEQSLQTKAERDDTGDERVLQTLRESLGISAREHAVMALDIQGASGEEHGWAKGDLFLGKYRVESLLADGGFSRTYLARDAKLGRRVVLKVARWESDREARRAYREARILARLGHPSIVAIHDAEEIGNELILVLEHVAGGSLDKVLARGPIPRDHAFGIACDLLDALAAAHGEGIVHRDVKPGNVLLDAQGRAKLADFGIAQSSSLTGTMAGLTFTTETTGTLRFMSPEQARGEAATPASDLYSIGVLLYESLAGRPYLDLDGLAEFEARQAILEKPPRLPIPEIPEAVNALLGEALAKDPADRPASAGAMRRRLVALAGSGNGATRGRTGL